MSASRNASEVENWLTQVWQSRSIAARLLWPLSLLFAALAALRRALYLTHLLPSVRLPVPVVVVGNVVVGGTGKTPLVIWLVDALRQAGYAPGVISRGYGGRVAGADVIEVTAASNADRVGDEPLLIVHRAQCPVMVGRDRVAAGRALLAAHPATNIIVSDDGLQHYRLQRSVEIILFDERGGGNGWRLPAGPLRESMKRRRDITVLNGAEMPASLPTGTLRMQLIGDYAEALSNRARRLRLRDLTGRIVAAAGIGNPQRFFSLLRNAGLSIETVALLDHQIFSADIFAEVDADIILITEKDAVKCVAVESLKNDPRIWVVPVTAHIDAALMDQIGNKLNLENLRGYPTA